MECIIFDRLIGSREWKVENSNFSFEERKF